MTVSPLPRPGGAASFDEFYRAFFPRVLMLVARHFPACDAEDIAQETMARCYTSYDTIEADRDPWPYVSSVARNAAIDALRRTSRLVPTGELPEPPGGGTDTTYDAVLVGERRRTVRSALSRLRPSDRQLIEDRELAGLAYADMAAVRDISTNSLRQQLFRARNRLAAELRQVGASLGVVPVAIQARFARWARRLDDVSAAAGPAGATALSIAAVAGITAFATMIATVPAGPRPAAAARPNAGTGAEATAAEPDAARGGGRPAAGPPGIPVAYPSPTPSPSPTAGDPQIVDVEVTDPKRPEQPHRHQIRVWTPLGPLTISGEGEHLDGYGLLCNLGVKNDCPESERTPPPSP